MPPHTIRGLAIILVVVTAKNASVDDLFALKGHVGLVSPRGAVGDLGRVWELLLLDHAQAATGRLGTVVVDAVVFGAGRENKTNSLALLGKTISGSPQWPDKAMCGRRK